MTELNLLRLVARCWRLLLCTAVLSGLAGYVLVGRIEPTYESSVQLLTGPIHTDFDTLRASGELARTYSELATTRPVIERVADEAGIEGGAEELKERVRVTASSVSRLITVIVQDDEPARAAAAASAFARQLLSIDEQGRQERTEAVDEFMKRDEVVSLPAEARDAIRIAADASFATSEASGLAIVNPPEVPPDPVSPRVGLLTLLSTLLGPILAFAFVVLRSVLRETVDSSHRLAELAPFPYLGSVMALGRRRNQALSPGAVADSPAGDAYRLLATKVGILRTPPTVRRVLVFGSDHQSDAGGVAAGLAAVAAAAGVRVVLVDVDIEQHAVTTLFGADELPGYTDLLGQGAQLEDVDLRRVGVPVPTNLDLIPVGAARQPAVDGASVAFLLDRLRVFRPELVIISAPPVGGSAASLAWARMAGVCLLVARRDRTPTAAVTSAAQALSVDGARVVGTVLVEGRKRFRQRGFSGNQSPAVDPLHATLSISDDGATDELVASSDR